MPATHFLFITLRITAFLAVAPAFASRKIPVRFRILLALFISIILGMSQISSSFFMDSPASWNTITFCVSALQEITLGAMLGICVLLIFFSLSVLGEAVSSASGLSFPVDGGINNQPQTILTQILYTLGVAIFFIFGGHRLIIATLIKTFTLHPPGMIAWHQNLFSVVTETFYLGFSLGIQMALPIFFLLLTCQLILALLYRVLPQINVFDISFPLNSLLILCVLSISLGSILFIFYENFQQLIQTIFAHLNSNFYI
ncbi:MAG: flagellar biosynthetic protein FliR [Planctomycetia bacterium]|nr:flagellar biosynthetic protein FliR [Planctomycetia bacterium]